MKNYQSIWLRSTIRLHPGWLPNGSAELPYHDAFAAPDFAITREVGEQFYTIEHVASGETREVHGANVRSATPMPAPKATQQKKGGR